MRYVVICLGFAAFGFLVGNITGLSSAQLTITLLGLLFSLIGGSITAFIGKASSEGRMVTGLALLAFSLPATFGLYLGIYVRINDLLSRTPKDATSISVEHRANPHDYLKASTADLDSDLKQKLFQGTITLDEICKIKAAQPGEINGDHK